MSLRKELHWTILIQGIGATAGLATVALAGILYGPAAQGEFSKLKSSLDFIISIAMLGIPQSLLYFLSKDYITKRQINILTLGVAVLGATLSFTYSLIESKQSPTTIALLAMAAAAGSAHGILRILILSLKSSWIFNVITAAPAFFLLLAFFWVKHTNSNIVISFFICWIFSATLAIYALKKPEIPESNQSANFSQLISFSGASWMLTILTSGVPALWLHYINHHIDIRNTGYFAMGMTITQIIITPINYATPILLKHWINQKNIKIKKNNLFIFCFFIFLIIILSPKILQLVPNFSFASEYKPLIQSIEYFALISILEGILRLTHTANIANGKPWLSAYAELIRIFSLFSIAFLTTPQTIQTLATTWIEAAFITIIFLWISNHLYSHKKSHP